MVSFTSEAALELECSNQKLELYSNSRIKIINIYFVAMFELIQASSVPRLYSSILFGNCIVRDEYSLKIQSTKSSLILH